MAVKFLDAKMVERIAARQDAMNNAVEILRKAVKLQAIAQKLASGKGKVSPKDKQFLSRNRVSVLRRAERILKQIDTINSSKWYKGKV